MMNRRRADQAFLAAVLMVAVLVLPWSHRFRQRDPHPDCGEEIARHKQPETGTLAPAPRRWLRLPVPLTWAGKLVSASVLAAVAAVVPLVVSAVTAAGPRLQPGGPVTFSVQVLPASRGTFVFARTMFLSKKLLKAINEAESLSDGDDEWFIARQAVEPFVSMVQLVVTGNAPAGVRIINLTVAKRCSDPLTGTLFTSTYGGGVQASTEINFNLDSAESDAKTPAGRDFFAAETIHLTLGEQQVIEIESATNSRFCAFTFWLTIRSGARTVFEHVTDGGRPFAVTAVLPPRRYKALYVGGYDSPAAGGAFVEENPRTWKPPAGSS